MQDRNNPATVGAPGRKPKSKRLLWVALILVVLMVTTVGYVSQVPSACDVKAVQEASDRLLRQRNRYDHSYQFAVTAARDAIVRPVGELQQILMDTNELPVPACMQTAKDELILYMGTVVRAFLAYGEGQANSAVRALIDESQAHYDDFSAELEAVNACAPLCIR